MLWSYFFHISFVILQDDQSKIKREAEGSQHFDIKHEKYITHELIPSIKIVKEV